QRALDTALEGRAGRLAARRKEAHQRGERGIVASYRTPVSTRTKAAQDCARAICFLGKFARQADEDGAPARRVADAGDGVGSIDLDALHVTGTGDGFGEQQFARTDAALLVDERQ